MLLKQNKKGLHIFILVISLRKEQNPNDLFFVCSVGVLWVRAHLFYCTAYYTEKSLTPGISIVYPICAYTEKHL